MSLIFVDGFDDTLSAQKWALQFTGTSYNSGGRNGNGLFVNGNGGGALRHVVAASNEHATFVFGKAFRSNSGAASSYNTSTAYSYGNIVSFLSDAGATPHVTVAFTGSGTAITVYRGGMNGVVIGTYSFTANVASTNWYYVEVKATLSDTVGTVEVRLNGTTVINLTAQDTKNAGTKTVFDSIGIQGSTGSFSDYVQDDLYLCNGAGTSNNGFLGDIAVETLYPNGNGTTNQFLGSDGNSIDNYLLVDEPGGVVTTDYADGTTGQQDLYAVANSARTSGSIYGVVASALAVNTDGGAQSLRQDVKSGATTSVGTAVPITTTQTLVSRIVETDPNTSAAWTVAGFNAAEFGVSVP